MLLALWFVNCTNKYRKISKLNDNLIEQGIRFLICFCFTFWTCYTLYYLIISYRAGRFHEKKLGDREGRELKQLKHFDVHSTKKIKKPLQRARSRQAGRQQYFYNCQIA